MIPLLPEQAALMTAGYCRTQVENLQPHQRTPILRDLLSRTGRQVFDVCPMTFSFAVPAVVYLQIASVFTGRLSVLTLGEDLEERDGFYRNSATEHQLFHADSEELEEVANSHDKTGLTLCAQFIQQGVNIGQAFGLMPASTSCDILITGTVPEFFDLYNTVAQRPGLYHPKCRELATECWLALKQIAPNLTQVIKDGPR